VKKWLAACCLAWVSFAGPPVVLAQEPPLQELAAPVSAGQLLLFRAEQITREGDVITCVGKVRAEYEGLQLDCQWLRYDPTTGFVEARKECLFTFGESFVASDEIDFSLQDKRAVMRRVFGRGNDLASSSQYVEQPLFFWADSMLWQPDYMELREATVTTCDKLPGQWDYRIVAGRIEIYPRERLEAYNTAVEFGGFRPITLPKLMFSLDPTQPLWQEYLPTLGYSALYGAFVRFAIPYSLDRRNSGKVHIDYYTRTGLAGGLEHRFNFDDRAVGDVFYYQQGGVDNRAGRFDFRGNLFYQIDDATVANFNYSQNRFELPNFTSPLTVSTQFGIQHQKEDYLVQLGAGYARSGDNTNTVYSGAFLKDFDERTRLLATTDFATASTLTNRTQRYHYQTTLQHRADIGDFEAALEGSSGQRTFFLNRTPELRFVSKPVYLGDLPFLASASYGRIQESPSNVLSNRFDLRVTLPDQMYSIGSSRLVVGAGLRQFFYDTGDQQRVLLGRASWYQPLGEQFTARADFNVQDPSGKTPFLHDFHTPYSVITGGVDFHNNGSLRLGAYAGYDLYRKQAHDVIGRLDYTPNNSFSLSSGTNYDPLNKQFRSIDNLLSVRLSDNLSLTHWSLYDFQQNKLTYQDVMLNFETHDWIASVAYRGLQQEVFFQLNLRGFPSPPLHVGPDPNLPVLPNNLSNPFVR
jgi:hypothetical protein